MSNTYLTNIEAANASLGWALAQTAYQMNNGGGLVVGLGKVASVYLKLPHGQEPAHPTCLNAQVQKHAIAM